MIIQLEKNLDQSERVGLITNLEKEKVMAYPVTTQLGEYLVAVSTREVDIRKVGTLTGVADIHRVSGDHKLVSKKWKVGRSVIDLGDEVQIGNGGLSIIAGPCSIESEAQIESMVSQLVQHGVRIMRGGVFKPRTNPYSFRGLGLEGLKLFYKHCRANGIKIITEVMESSQIEQMYPYVDVYQVGARNSQNFNLLDNLGEVDKPVLLKRGISGTIDELLHSAEYVFKNGNEKLLLCERGIRSFEKAYRNTLDLNAVPILKERSHLPVIVDPSHGIGIRRHVVPMSLASVAAGADGIMVEVHEKPEEAATDGQQTLDYEEFARLVEKLRAMENLLLS